MTVPTIFLCGVPTEARERILAAALPVRFVGMGDVEPRFSFVWFDQPDADWDALLFRAGLIGGLDTRTEVWFASPDQNSPLRSLYMFIQRETLAFIDPVDALRFLVESDLRTMRYADYLKTDHWKSIRHDAIEAAGYRCQLCNSDRPPLHVHHRTYERRGEEEPEDVIALCASCHATFHKKLPKDEE